MSREPAKEEKAATQFAEKLVIEEKAAERPAQKLVIEKGVSWQKFLNKNRPNVQNTKEPYTPPREIKEEIEKADEELNKDEAAIIIQKFARQYATGHHYQTAHNAGICAKHDTTTQLPYIKESIVKTQKKLENTNQPATWAAAEAARAEKSLERDKEERRPIILM